MVKKNATGRGNRICGGSKHKEYNLAGVQAVFSCSFVFKRVVGDHQLYHNLLALAGGDGDDGGMCAPFFVMTVAGWWIIG